MKTLLLSIGLVVGTFTSLTVHSGSGARSNLDIETIEARERELDFQLAPIKSAADLRAYLNTRQNRQSPLNLLSPGARQRFVQSLVFSEKGLASFDYRDIRVELTTTQAYELLSLFGAQRSTEAIPDLRVLSPSDAAIQLSGGNPSIMTDYMDYWCSSRGTCSRRIGDICIGSSCVSP